MPVSKFPGGTLLAAVLAFLSMTAGAQSPVGPSEYGQIMIAEYEMPPEQIARFAEFRPSAADSGESALVNALLADTEDWVGPEQTLDASTNPYSLVVTLTGTALADGDIRSLWQSGWRMEDGMTRLNAFPGLSKDRVKAGQTVTLIRQSPPTTFTSNPTVSPVLALVNMSNFRLETMTVQLWAGVGEATATETSLAFYGLWVGLGLLVLGWWWRRA